ncbi:MAG UNVERIFIED_CONTAM: preprotein translocase subunit SecG [Rickettsiaceae bacterium]|jgi:preprotein translocase subunit SecG
MLDILLVMHIVISVLLIIVILLQKNSSDGLAGLGGGGSNMGLVNARTAANFFTRVTVFLATLFMLNSLVLANLSNRTHKESDVVNKLKEEKKETQTLPIAR